MIPQYNSRYLHLPDSLVRSPSVSFRAVYVYWKTASELVDKLILSSKAKLSLSILSFWVCEKSDGVRVLMLIAYNGAVGRQDIFLVCTSVSCLAQLVLIDTADGRHLTAIDRSKKHVSPDIWSGIPALESASWPERSLRYLNHRRRARVRY